MLLGGISIVVRVADGVSYGAGDYRNAIQTIYDQMALDESLLEDDRRIEINVPYV